MKAQDLISAARAKRRELPGDSVSPQHRVSSEKVCEMLTGGGFACSSLDTIQLICRKQIGRTSWAKR